MPGFYSTGAAWMNSDVRPLYLRGDSATYLVFSANDPQPRTERTLAERVPGRSITPREAYDAFEEGHLAGREFRGFGLDERSRSVAEAWGRSEAFAAAHPGVALARRLRDAEQGERAAAQLPDLRKQLAALESVERELARASNEQRNAARECTAALSTVFENTQPVRAILANGGPAPAEEVAHALRGNPSALAAVRPDAKPEDLRATLAAAERLAAARRSGATTMEWAENEVRQIRRR